MTSQALMMAKDIFNETEKMASGQTARLDAAYLRIIALGVIGIAELLEQRGDDD